jgi:DNA-binding GntR family transcriptional regulator
VSLPGIKRRTIAGYIYEKLKDEIIRLFIKPGDTLSEAEVARRFSVSRQPVREAFIHLADDGFLLIRPQRPTIVKPISETAVRNARFIRDAIEVAVVAEAARHWTDAASAELVACIETQRRAAAADEREAFHEADERFHQVIAEHAGYPFAWEAIHRHKAQMDRVRYLSLGSATNVTIAEHEAIAGALAERDPEASVAAMHRHLMRILDHLSDLRRLHADYFDEVDGVATTARVGHSVDKAPA